MSVQGVAEEGGWQTAIRHCPPELELQTEHYLPGAFGGAAECYVRDLCKWEPRAAHSCSAHRPQQVVFSCI
jgi:hypothetical protein